MKRRSSYWLIVALLISALSISALATGTADTHVVNQPDGTITISHVNPEYARAGVKFEKPSADCMTYATTTVSTFAEASDYLREQMEDRVTEVTIKVTGYTFVDNATISADWKTILYGAWEHTGVSTQGDYILRHYGKAEGQIGFDGYSTATFVYTITYDTTIEQENTVGEKIDELFTQWDEEADFYEMTDYEKVCTIYDYICANVTYDYDNLNDDSYTLKYSAYAALINGTAVCQGYANLFYRMALEAEIDTRIVVGFGGGGYHGWNIVDMGDKYYYLDATWDSGRVENDLPYKWFLLGSEQFLTDHTTDASNSYDCNVANYPIDTKNYEPKAKLAAPTVTVSNNASTGKLVISWTEVPGAQSYEVYRASSKNGTYKKLTTTDKLTVTNSSVNAGETWYYKVRAIAEGAEGEYSEVVGKTCDLARPTVTVTNDAATGKLVISWKEVPGASRYEVYRAASKNGTYKKLTTTTALTVTNASVNAGETYYYRVKAIFDGNSGADSAASTAVGKTCDLARPTVTVTNDAATGKLVISWKEIPGASSYEVYRATTKDGTYKKLTTTTKLTVTNASINAGETYYYRVKAIFEGNSGADSAASVAVGKTCDLARPTVTVTNSASTGKIVVSWKEVKGADRYEVYRATSKNGTYKKLTTTTKLSVTNASINAGETYYYRVKAIFDDNSGANSAASTAVGKTCDLARPTVTVALNGENQPAITWAEITGAVGYEIYRAVGEGEYALLETVTTTEFVDVSVEGGVTYSYKVRALCSVSGGHSAYSTAQSVTVEIVEEPEPEPDPEPEEPMTMEEIVEAAYALQDGESLAEPHTLTGIIVSVNTVWSEQYQNITVTIQVGELAEMPIKCYRLAGEGANEITIGDTITVTGTLTKYNGTVEFAQGCTLDSFVKGEGGGNDIDMTDVEAVLKAAYELEENTSMTEACTLTGKITSIDTAWSEDYKNITVTIVIEGYEDMPIMCYRLKGDGAADLAIGDTITVTGILKNYKGTVEFDQGCTLDAVIKN